MKQQLGIILHTNNPTEYFAVAHPSMCHLVPMLSVVNVALLFNFQPPWTPTQIVQVYEDLERMRFEVAHVYSRPKPIVSTYKLRHDAAALKPTVDWWMYCDDNLCFAAEGTPAYPGGSAVRYLEVLDYFNTFPNCGVVMCEGSLGGHAAKRQIRPTTNGLISTARGLFFRNTTGGQLHTTEEYRLKGGMGEIAPAYRLMSEGYFLAKQFNNPTRHLHKHRLSDDVPATHVTNYEKVIKPNAERYIRDVYDDPEWTLEQRYIPDTVKASYRLHGGDGRAFERPSPYWREYPR